MERACVVEMANIINWTWTLSIYSVVLVYLLVWPFIILANQTTTRYIFWAKLKTKTQNIQEETITI